jgi:hypothetical protein
MLRLKELTADPDLLATSSLRGNCAEHRGEVGETHFYVDVMLSAIFVPPEISSTQRNDCRYGAEDDKSLTWKSKKK